MARGKRAPGNDEDSRTVELFFTPWLENTYVTANLAWRGRHGGNRVLLGHWRVDVARQGLARRPPDDVIRILLESLLYRLESGSTDGYTHALTRPPAAGPGAPLGATGGTVSSDQPLPGM